MVERLLELARRKADAAEVHLVETESRPIQFENNDLKYVHTKSSRVLSLRVIHRGRIGFASTTDPSTSERLVAQAVESAQFGQEAKFAFPPSAACPDVAVYDPRVADFPVEQGIQLGRDAIARVLGEFADVQCYVEISKSVGTERIANTSGLACEERRTGFDCGLTAVRVRDGGILWVSDGESSRALVANFDRYTAKVTGDIRQAETEAAAPTGAVPVLFTARAVGLLLQFLESAVNGKLVQKGASPLVGRLGEQVLGPEVTICDDATRPFGDGSVAFDAEGVPAQRTPLFERGVLRSYLFDLQTAGMLGAASTGNAGRGFAAVPMPEASNFVLEPGSATFDGLLAGIERGLLVDEVIGGGQSNVLAGEFSVNVSLGFLVERGERVGRVKDCMVAGNVFEIFKRIRGLGSTQEVHGPIVAPPVCFDGVHVAGGD
ncbi:MAG TPA: TldD/PmbA family protein [Planctomycetota bacterium]|nr:TldD/PmbA family protein [Planctomycetota bacterium]